MDYIYACILLVESSPWVIPQFYEIKKKKIAWELRESQNKGLVNGDYKKSKITRQIPKDDLIGKTNN